MNDILACLHYSRQSETYKHLSHLAMQINNIALNNGLSETKSIELVSLVLVSEVQLLINKQIRE